MLTTATVKSPIAAIGYILIVYLYFYENRKLILHQLTTVSELDYSRIIGHFLLFKAISRITNIVNGHDFNATARINMP